MAKQITKTLYTYRELKGLHDRKKISAQAFERATDWLREGQTDHDWWDSVYEIWQSALAQLGFEDAKISFSGFWSQGDGASFTCASVDVRKLITFLLDPPPTQQVRRRRAGRQRTLSTVDLAQDRRLGRRQEPAARQMAHRASDGQCRPYQQPS